MSVIRIKRGTYRNAPVINTTFKLVKGYQVGVKGGYITVKNQGHFPVDIDNIKIKVETNRSVVNHECLSSTNKII